MIKALVNIASSDKSLRPYQIDSKQKIYEAWTGIKSVLFQMPTGTGKTRLFASIIKDIRNISVQKKIIPQPRILILVHRTELINQIYNTLLHKYHISCGIIKSGVQETPNNIVQIAAVQSLSRRISRWIDVPFGYIVIDEAHHALAKTYLRICKLYPGAKILGVTATPFRLNRESFRKVFDKLIVSKSVQQFIKEGYLSPLRYYSIKPEHNLQYDIDSIDIFGTNGDYAEQELIRICDKTKIRAQLIKSYKDYAFGKKGIVYSINKIHNKHIASQYEEIGVRVATIDADTPELERSKIVNDFRAGRLDIICNVNIFSEGFDCPDVDFVQLARPTLSLSLYLQQVGRALRKSEGKDCALILDNVGSYNKFGLPTKPRNWDKYFNGLGYREQLRLKRNIKNKKTQSQEIKEADEDMILIDSAESIEDFDILQCENSEYSIFDILSSFEQFPIGVRKHIHDLECTHMRSQGEFEKEEILHRLCQSPIASSYHSLKEYVEETEREISGYEILYNDCESAHFMCDNTFMFSANGRYGICRLKSSHKDIFDVCSKIKKSSTIPTVSEYFEELLEPMFDKIEIPNSNDVFIAIKNGKYGAINGEDLSTIISFEYNDLQEVSPFFLYYIAEKKSKVGILNHNGEIILPIQYDAVYPNKTDGLFVCELDEKYIIALNGKLINKLENTKIKQLTNELSVYSLQNNKQDILFLTDNNGYIVFPYSATAIFLTQNDNEICLEFNNKHMLIDYDLNLKTLIVQGTYPCKKKSDKPSVALKKQNRKVRDASKEESSERLDVMVKQKCEQIEKNSDLKHKRPRIRRVIPYYDKVIHKK